MGLLLACPPLPVISNALAYIIKLRILLVLKLQIHSQAVEESPSYSCRLLCFSTHPAYGILANITSFNEMPCLLLRTSCSCVPGVLCKWDLLAISVGGTQLASRQQSSSFPHGTFILRLSLPCTCGRWWYTLAILTSIYHNAATMTNRAINLPVNAYQKTTVSFSSRSPFISRGYQSIFIYQ